MTDLRITTLPAAPLHTVEIWSNPATTANRFEARTGFALPPMGHSAGGNALRLIRYEPAVWLAEGDVSALPDILADNGAITAIGGGIIRAQLSGAGWRALLMESGVFDAEDPTFGPGCSAATTIDHVPVRLFVDSENSCIAYVPRSFSESLLHFWRRAAGILPAAS